MVKAGRSLGVGHSRDVAIGVRAKDAERINDRLGYGMRVEVSDRILSPVHETVSGVSNAVLFRSDGYLDEWAARPPYAGTSVRLSVYYRPRYVVEDGIDRAADRGLGVLVRVRAAMPAQAQVNPLKTAVREALWNFFTEGTAG